MRSTFCGKSIRKRSAHHVPEWGKKKNKKRHRAFFKLRLVVLAKLSRSEADFARDSGTMPPLVEVGFPFILGLLVKVKFIAGLVGQSASVSAQCAAQQIVGGELLILALIESSLGHNHSGGCE